MDMTLESIKEAMDKIMAMPPSVIKMRCSEDTFNYFKSIIPLQEKEPERDCDNMFNSFYGIDIFKTDEVETGSIENIYSDGSTKTIKVF
jgi:hypothetical protein